MRGVFIASVHTHYLPGNALPAKFLFYCCSSPHPHRLRLTVVFQQDDYSICQPNSVSGRTIRPALLLLISSELPAKWVVITGVAYERASRATIPKPSNLLSEGRTKTELEL